MEPEPLAATLAKAPVFSRVSYAPMLGCVSFEATSKTLPRAAVPPIPPMLPADLVADFSNAPGRAPL